VLWWLYFSWTMTFKVFSFSGFSPMSLQDSYKWLAPMSPGGLVKPLCFWLTYFCLLSQFNIHWPWKRRSFHVIKHRWHFCFCEEILPTAHSWHTKAQQKYWLEKENHSINVLFSLAKFQTFFRLITDHKNIKNFSFLYGHWRRMLNNIKTELYHMINIELSPIASFE